MLSTTKSANVGCRQVVQLFAPLTNPAMQLRILGVLVSGSSLVGVCRPLVDELVNLPAGRVHGAETG